MSKIGKKENGRYLSWKDTSNGPYSWMSKTHLLWDKFTFILLFSCWLLQSSNMNFYANGFYKDTLLVYIYKSCMEVSQTLFLAFSIIRYPFWLFHKWRGSSSKKRQGQFGHSNKAKPIVLIQTHVYKYWICSLLFPYCTAKSRESRHSLKEWCQQTPPPRQPVSTNGTPPFLTSFVAWASR